MANEALRETLQHVLLKKQNLTRGDRKLDQKQYDEYSEVEVLLMAELNKRAAKKVEPEPETPVDPPKVEKPKNPYGKYASGQKG